MHRVGLPFLVVLLIGLSFLRAEPEKLPAGATTRIMMPAEYGGVGAVAFSPDGKMLAVLGYDRSVRLCEAATGKEIRSWTEPQWVRGLAFAPDGSLLATGASLRETATGKEVPRFQRRSATSRCAAFSPDGKRLAVGYDDRKTVLWETATGQELFQIDSEDDWIMSLAFSPDGKLLAVGGYGSFGLHESDTGKLTRRVGGHRDFVHALAFAPDGRTIASASADRTIRVWNVAKGEEIARIPNHHAKVYALAFSPTGRVLASGGADRKVRLTEVASLHQVRECECPGEVRAVAFSPDGRRVASGSEDGSALVWDITGWTEDGVRPPLEVKPEELETLFTDLASAKGPQADRAKWRLVAAAKQSLPFLGERLRGVGADRIGKLVAELDSDQFADREKAMEELEKIGVLAEPWLRRALEGKPSLEVTRRIEKLLENIEKRSAARWQALRAAEVLELIGTPEAKLLLESIKK